MWYDPKDIQIVPVLFVFLVLMRVGLTLTFGSWLRFSNFLVEFDFQHGTMGRDCKSLTVRFCPRLCNFAVGHYMGRLERKRILSMYAEGVSDSQIWRRERDFDKWIDEAAMCSTFW